MKIWKSVRYSIMAVFFALLTIFSIRHFVLGGGIAPSVDALCPFGGFETLYSFIISGAIVPRVMLSSLILAVGLIITVIIFRKGFCGYICPFGTIQEFLGGIKKKKFKVPDSIDRYAKYLKYLILLTIIIGTSITSVLVFRGYDPFVTFFHFGKGIFWDYNATEFNALIVGFVILIIVLSASIFIDRFWCRYFCPLAAAMNIFAKFSFTRIYRNDKCNDCKICDMKCPASLKISQKSEVKDVECINCNICVDSCPKKAISVKVFGKNASSIIYAALLVIVFFSVIFASKSLGFWESVPQTVSAYESGSITPETIYGWTTVRNVADGLGVSPEVLIGGLGLPLGIDPDMALRDIKNVVPGFETEVVREFVRNYEVKTYEPDCPWHLKNDTSPGLCGLYVDNDKNGVCDYSE